MDDFQIQYSGSDLNHDPNQSSKKGLTPLETPLDGENWITIDQGVLLDIEMKGKPLDFRFYVVDEMPREAIIGVDFMQSWEIRLDPKNHDFTIGIDPNAIEMA